MRIKQTADVPLQDVQVAGATGVGIRWLIAKDDQPENFCMRLFELAPGGHTPYHGHPWEHEVFILQGEGRLRTPQGERRLRPESVIHVPAGEEHQFRNTGSQALKFICVVPNSAEY